MVTELPDGWHSYPFEVRLNYLRGRYTRPEALREVREIIGTDGEGRSKTLSKYEAARVLVLLGVPASVDTPPGFYSWEVTEQADWVAFELGRKQTLERTREIVGTDGEGRSQTLAAHELAGILAALSSKQPVPDGDN